MTNQQKFFLLIVLIVAGAGATIYVNTNKSNLSVDNNSKNTASNIVDNIDNTSPTVNNTQNTPSPVQNTNPTPVQAITSPVVQPVVKTPTQYVNNVSYYTPSGMSEMIHVTISVLNGAVSDITFSYDSPTNRESGRYLSRFSSSLDKNLIIGKKLTNVSLSRVGGASLTTDAFMQAIQDTASKV